MRSILLYITLLFGLAFTVNGEMPACATPDSDASTVSQTLPERPSADQLPNKELLLSSAQNLLSLSEEGGVCPLVPIQQSNSRTPVSSKSPFLLIHNGKILDVRTCFLLSISHSNTSGSLSHSRYLYTLRKIRI